ncbi:GLI pathogenesis-related 2 [Heptranchias perlo]|uniref:GLI pathogenesis-related 2 n=1 Tax=Heptranchias perlo TaxID=212740 RepID=UPI00355A5A7D
MASDGAGSGSFAEQLLKSLNEYRGRHEARPLTLNPTIGEKAEKWAEHLVTSRTLKHSETSCGENIWCQQGPASLQATGQQVADSWYNEIKNYDFSSPGFQKNCGHFTQLVWRDSREIGIGLASDGKGLTVVVAQFDPAGNITNPGYFAKNVLPVGSEVKESEGGSAQGGSGKTPGKPGTTRVAPVTGAGSGSFAEQLLKSLNEYRGRHGARPLTLNPTIGEKAEKWAENLVTSRTLKHSETSCGENIWCQQGPASLQATGQEATDSWYKEIEKYDFSAPGFQKNCGHFTQLVWRDSREIGIGLASDGKGLTVVVAQFDPAGNITNPGYFAKNVLPVGSEVKESEGGSAQGGSGKTPGKPGMTRVAPVTDKERKAFIAELVQEHNRLRALHQSQPLQLKSELSVQAQKWAEHLIDINTLQHSDTEYGENLWYKWSSNTKLPTGKEASEAWYNEIKQYDFNSPGFHSGTGHFTQLVWRDSREIGIGLASDGKGLTVVVAQFDPAGNITNPGYFAKNVLPVGSEVKESEGGSAQGGSGKTPGKPGMTRVAPVTDKERKAFIAELVQEHNRLRALHQSQPLQLKSELSVQAQKWAEHLIDINTLQHSDTEYGENLWYKWSSNTKLPTGKEASEAWYNEIKQYDFNSPGFHSGTGHFTQMVWKASREMGVGYATDGKGMFMAVAVYNPSGNITNPGYFKDNVLPPRKK